MAITSSFENLRSTEKKQKSKPESQSHQPDPHSQSLNIRSSSPLFARRTSIDTLMAPINTSPMKEEGKGRNRSWTAGVGEIWRGPQSADGSSNGNSNGSSNGSSNGKSKDQDGKEKEQKASQREEEDKANEDNMKSIFKTPHRSFGAPRRRRNLQGSDEGRRLRHSLTPPSSATLKKYLRKGHRRSTSNVVSSSWRQEIFDSVCTPTKLEAAFPGTDSDICKMIYICLSVMVIRYTWCSGGVAGDRDWDRRDLESF